MTETAKPHKRVPKPTAFMQAIKKRRLELQTKDSAFGQEGVASILGITFGTYSDYELGRVTISHTKAEMLLDLMVEGKDRDDFRTLEGFPPNEKTASEILEPIARRLFSDEEPLPLSQLLLAVRSERDDRVAQQSFTGAVEGAAINNGTLDPVENRFKEIIGKLGYDGSDASVEKLYREGREASRKIAARKSEFPKAMFILRYYDNEHATLSMPPAEGGRFEPVWSFKRLAEALDDAGHPISDGHLKRCEMGSAVPTKPDAEAIAAIFGFDGPTAEADMYATATRLKVTHPRFPDKTVSSPSLSVARFGEKLKDVREILGITQADISVLDPAIPMGTIAGIELGERKTPLPSGMMNRIYKALELDNAAAFDELAQDASHVIAIRKKNFGEALKLWREETLGNMKQDTLYQKVQTEYLRLQDQYGLPFTPFKGESQMSSWERGTIPSHPMMVTAINNVISAGDEVKFYTGGGLNEAEVNPEAFQKVAAHLDKTYKALVTKASASDSVRDGLSMFARRNRVAGEWETAAQQDRAPDNNIVS